MDIQTLATERRIFTCRGGSHAYGLHGPESDEDFRGIFVGLPDNLLGLFPVEHCEFGGDYMVYELKKFVSLAKDCNPNIIELLWVDESDILARSPLYDRLRQNRDLFLTKKARHTFSGYAHAQLKKIRSHKAWIQNPQPVEQPSPAKYLKTKFIEGLGHRELFDQVAFDTAHKQWKQYHEWKQNRNPKRAELEEKFSFDCKHAMHLIRLARMANEIMRGEGVRVKRHDRDDLLAIRRGEWSYEQVVAHAEELDGELDGLYAQSKLPHSPDVAKISELLVGIYRDFWRERGEI